MAAAEAFKASGHNWRLFCGAGVIEKNLLAAVDRAGAKRAIVVCSPSVNRRTNTVRRIEAALGDRYAGVFDEIEKDSTFTSVMAAKVAAQTMAADMLIAVGGGSVIVANRATAIFLGEARDPFEIMTQYPKDASPYSPRLKAPKLPIINIPTTPTSAMNRAGTGLKNMNLEHRMEYFDPKTRPSAIFIDDDALMTAPDSLIRSTATTVFAALIGGADQAAANPLTEGDRAHALKLGRRAYLALPGAMDDPSVRRELCLAAFLQNRAEDDGQPLFRRGPFSGDYAVSTALHVRFPEIGQGESTSVVQVPAIRLAEGVDPAAAERVARALEVWREGMDVAAASAAVADRLETVYAAAGMPANLRALNLPRDAFPKIADETVKNFNARLGRGTPEERIAATMRLLEAAW